MFPRLCEKNTDFAPHHPPTLQVRQFLHRLPNRRDPPNLRDSRTRRRPVHARDPHRLLPLLGTQQSSEPKDLPRSPPPSTRRLQHRCGVAPRQLGFPSRCLRPRKCTLHRPLDFSEASLAPHTDAADPLVRCRTTHHPECCTNKIRCRGSPTDETCIITPYDPARRRTL